VNARECKTCFRVRPSGEFMLRMDERRGREVPICRSCRVLLWDDPDDASEVESALLARPEG
jgi:hypothetical protein